MQARAAIACGALLISVCSVASACGGDDPRPEAKRPAQSSTTTPSPTSDASRTEGTFDVGGHKLYIRCEGSGSPTVVYLHGYIQAAGTGGSHNAGRIPELLANRNRVCVYDRANVGGSDVLPGPLTGTGTVRDLHALLKAADVSAPFVLLGASYGGLIADMYAATYPDEIVGLVLLDPALPGGDAVIDAFLPEPQRLQTDTWKEGLEKLDLLVTDRQAKALAGSEPQVPMTLIAIKDFDLDPAWRPKKRIIAAYRRLQREFVARFERGRLLTVDVPHFMEPEIPERIAEETRRVIDRAQ